MAVSPAGATPRPWIAPAATGPTCWRHAVGSPRRRWGSFASSGTLARPRAVRPRSPRAMNPTDLVDRDSLRTDVPDFAPGDSLKVHVRVVEGTRERVQIF